MAKTLNFDANNITACSRTSNVINVEIETDYLDEVLNEFNTDEIIQNYSDLDELYDALKEYFDDGE